MVAPLLGAEEVEPYAETIPILPYYRAKFRTISIPTVSTLASAAKFGHAQPSL